MPVTNFARKDQIRSAELTTPPLNWFDPSIKEVFALTSVRALPRGHLDVNLVGYAADPSIAKAWTKKGVLPEGHDSSRFRPYLTAEHLFPEQQ